MSPIEIAKHADQVEFGAFRNHYAVAGDGLDDEFISGEAEDRMTLDKGPGESEDWSELDRYTDNHQGKIMQELKARSGLLQGIYPFDLRHSALIYNKSKSVNKVYEALLMTSLTTRRQGIKWLELIDSFEKLSAWAVKKFFGCDEVWWTGANSNAQFKELIERIHEQTGELEWNLDKNLFNSHRKIKDAGLDFINYRRLDERKGGLFYFGQCACGTNWLEKTELDLRSKSLERIFRQPYANPVKLFTIPYLITYDGEQTLLRAADNFSGLVFDRARLSRLLIEMNGDERVLPEIQKVLDLASTKCN